jgi:regulator of protease activity HflC (stomatin/prohibitin superfamily)
MLKSATAGCRYFSSFRSRIGAMGIAFVPEKHTALVDTFGRYSKSKSAGLRFYIPIIQSMTIISNEFRNENFTLNTKTKDNAFIDIHLSYQYKIDVENSNKAHYEFSNVINQLTEYMSHLFILEISNKDIDDVFNNKEAMINNIKGKLTSPDSIFYGIVNVPSIYVLNITPDVNIQKSMNEVVQSEKMKQAIKNKAEAHYIEVVKHAEADSERKRLQGVGLSLQRQEIMNGYKNSMQELTTMQIPTELLEFIIRTQELDVKEALSASRNSKIVFWSDKPNKLVEALEVSKN